MGNPERKPIHVSRELYNIVADHASKWAISIGEAVDRLLTTAVKRRAAVNKYAVKVGRSPKAKKEG